MFSSPRRSSRFASGKQRSQTRAKQPALEPLEARCVPSSLQFIPGVGGVAAPQFGPESVSRQGGISSHPGAPGDLSGGAPVWLIFDEPNGNANFGFDGSVSPSQITAAVISSMVPEFRALR